MKHIFGKKRLAASLILCAAAVLIRILGRAADGFADAFRGVWNPFFVQTAGRAADLFPFSVAETLVYIVILWLVFSAVSVIVSLVRERGGKKTGTKRMLGNRLLTVLLLGSLVFFLYEANEDVYFYAERFSVTAGYGRGGYSTESLAQVCEILVYRINRAAPEVQRDGDDLMVCSAKTAEKARQAMRGLGEDFPVLAGFYPKAKPIAISRLMSMTDMAGLYTSWTGEANYNRDMAPYNFPHTMCHESAHIKGVQMEDEANFIAYLALADAEDPELAYSGAMLAWIYCGNELYARDLSLWRRIAGRMDSRAQNDLAVNTAFWKKYKSPVSEKAQDLNNTYLVMHGQTEGVLSYDRVVDLIVSYETERSGLAS